MSWQFNNPETLIINNTKYKVAVFSSATDVSSDYACEIVKNNQIYYIPYSLTNTNILPIKKVFNNQVYNYKQLNKMSASITYTRTYNYITNNVFVCVWKITKIELDYSLPVKSVFTYQNNTQYTLSANVKSVSSNNQVFSFSAYKSYTSSPLTFSATNGDITISSTFTLENSGTTTFELSY